MPSISEYKNFEVNSANLKHVRTFAREVFNKSETLKNYQEELVLALAEAAQNIVKHACTCSATLTRNTLATSGTSFRNSSAQAF